MSKKKIVYGETNLTEEDFANPRTFKCRWSEEDKAFLVTCNEYPSLTTHGATEEEAEAEMLKLVDALDNEEK